MLVSLALPMSLMFSMPVKASPIDFTLISPKSGCNLTPALNFYLNVTFPYNIYPWFALWYWGTYSGGGWVYSYAGGSRVSTNISHYTSWAQTGFNGALSLNYNTNYSIKISLGYDDQNPPDWINHTYIFKTTSNVSSNNLPANYQVQTIGSAYGPYDHLQFYGAPEMKYPSSIYRYVKGQYFVRFDGIIKQIQIGIYSKYALHGIPTYSQQNVNDFYAWINKYSLGNPSTITWTHPQNSTQVSPGYTESFGVMIWNCSVSINTLNSPNPQICLEMQTSNKNFRVRINYPNVDLNGDGLYCEFSDKKGIAPSGLMDIDNGILYYVSNQHDYFSDGSHDLGWQFTYGYNATGNDINNLGGNWLSVDGAKVRYQPLYISYAVNDLSQNYYLQVTQDELNQWNATTYGMPIVLYQGTYVFVPQDKVTYTFSIRNATNGTIASKSILVADSSGDYIEAVPGFGNTLTSIHLFYKYSSNKPGEIGVFTSANDTNDFSKSIDSIGGISADGNTYYQPKIGINYPEDRIYFRLFYFNNYSNNALTPVGNSGVFTIYTTKQTNLQSLSPTIKMGPTGGNDIFSYSHNYVGAQVGIFIGDSVSKLTEIKDVSDAKTGSAYITFASLSNGIKIVALQVYLSGHWRMICNTTVNVSYSAGYVPIVPANHFEWDVVGWIGPLWAAVFGLAIVIICVSVPLIIDLKYKSQLSRSIPPLAWTFFGAAGVAISIVLGLWPFWVTFFIMGLAVFMIVFLYIYRMGWIHTAGGK